MTTEPLAMFPLGAVVLPGEATPLRVFEPRYRRLVLDCLANDTPEFGTVLIERGSEVGGGDQRASVGVRLLLRNVSPTGEGRFDVIVGGLGRIVVHEWLDDDPYPRAHADDWPDPPLGAATAEHASARFAALSAKVSAVRELAAKAAPTLRGGALAPVKVTTDIHLATYQLAAAVPLGPADRHRLLAAPTLEARFDAFEVALGDTEAALRFQLPNEPDRPA